MTCRYLSGIIRGHIGGVERDTRNLDSGPRFLVCEFSSRSFCKRGGHKQIFAARSRGRLRDVNTVHPRLERII